MAQKRSVADAELGDCQSPKKKQKQSNDNEQLMLCVDTKLGHSEKSFFIKDLRLIKYFDAQLSDRWNNYNTNSALCINSKDLEFTVNEIEMLISMKKHNVISIKYPHTQRTCFI